MPLEKRTMREPQKRRAKGDGARCHDNDFLASGAQFRDFGSKRRQPVPPGMAFPVDQQRRPDLEDEAAAIFGTGEIA